MKKRIAAMLLVVMVIALAFNGRAYKAYAEEDDSGSEESSEESDDDPSVDEYIIVITDEEPVESESNSEEAADKKPEYVYDTYYVSAIAGVNIRSTPEISGDNVIRALPYNSEIKVRTIPETNWVCTEAEEFICIDFLSKEKGPSIAAMYEYEGTQLSQTLGTISGPSGKETYYNLPMHNIVAKMRSIGNNDPYWIRNDGAKMLGEYVMVAADLSLRPRGSLVPTSLGMGIVCDTGDFKYTNRNQIDVAVNW